MFFQAIYQMISTGTDLSINIRKVDNSLSVAIMPRRNSLKEEIQGTLVPLIVNGTPEELDMGLLQTIAQPLQKVQGLLANAESFEKQAEKATSQTKAKSQTESKEAREKREKMEKLLKKADDATTAQRYSEALTWLKQAKILASADKQKEIDAKMQEVQKLDSAGNLFAMEEQTPVIPQSQINAQPPSVTQAGTYAEQQPRSIAPDPLMKMQSDPRQISQQVAPQPIPRPEYGTTGGYMQQMPVPESVQGGFAPQGTAIPTYSQQPCYQPGMDPYQPRQIHQQQTTNSQIQNATTPMQNGNGREYRTAPSARETFCFDPEDENDRELLREDPYAEYPDFPAESRMKDDAQVETIYC